MKHIKIGLIFAILLPFVAIAQVAESEIEFNTEAYNFGTIDFGNQKVNATFIFTNNSDKPFEIKDVRASCGCTVPAWPEKPIMPGKKGVITATFDPTNLAGEVDKHIEIFGNWTDIMSKILSIQGTILEPDQDKLNKIYPGQFGYLKQTKNTLALGDIVNTQVFTDTVVFYNSYNLDLKIKEVTKKPEYVSISLGKTTLKAGDTSRAIIRIDARRIADYGLINEEIVFKTTDRSYPYKAVKLAFFVREDFSQLKKRQIKKKPNAVLSSTEFNFGEMREGAEKSMPVVLKNTGKSPLKVLKVKIDCGCTALDLEGITIEPGTEKLVELWFDSMYMTGDVSKEVVLFTNDPQNHILKLYITARVLKN